MGYWVYLQNEKGESLSVEPHNEGGVQVWGQNDVAEMSVTYNYGKYYWNLLGDGGLKWLHSQTGGQTIPQLEKAIEALGNDVDPNYWKPTEGNAKRVLVTLLSWARQHPDGQWYIS